jgi:hypothetical protein
MALPETHREQSRLGFQWLCRLFKQLAGLFFYSKIICNHPLT